MIHNLRTPAEELPDTAQKYTNTLQIFLWLGLLLGAIMLLAFPVSKPIWDDEMDSIMQGSKPYLTILTGASDTQPPLHFLILRLCQTFGGGNLVVYRLVSAFPAVIALWYVYLLGKRISPQVSVVAVWLTALSPSLILFDRMARYHGLVAMLTTMSVYYCLAGLKSGRRQDLVKYALTTFLMLITYYLSLFVLIAQFLFILSRWRSSPYIKSTIIALAIAIIMFLPWFIHGLHFAHQNIAHDNVEDPAMSLGVNGFIRRLGLPLYSFCLGETVYPWNWPVVVVGCFGIIGAFWLGMKRTLRYPELLLLGAVVLLVLFLSALATSGPLGRSQTVGSMSKRVSFVLPLLYVISATGIFSMRGKWLQNIWLCLIFLPSLYAVFNYWTNQQFLNPNYIAPWDQAISIMKQRQWGPNTYILSCGDPALHYYVTRQLPLTPHYNAGEQSTIQHDFAIYHPHYVWVVSRDRGDQLAVQATESLNEQFRSNFVFKGEYGVMPRGEKERYWLGKLLKRPASRYYVWLDLYDTQGKGFQAPQH